MIEILNLPKRIPRKLNKKRISDMNYLFIKKFEIEKAMLKMFQRPYYINVTLALGDNEYCKKELLIILISYHARLRNLLF